MSNERLSHSFTPLVPSAKEEMEQTSPFPLKDAEDTLSLIQKNPTPNSRAISGTLARTRLQNNETVQSTNRLVIIQKKKTTCSVHLRNITVLTRQETKNLLEFFLK